ncbi:type II secretion system F family protein [Phycicoccus sp. M110.8]|uniref:type II secretion system F family protein n=1 Tax=Phycicoccus sp. M110.8 TaxID=3075433 RepID=UPI0028FD3B13|nr:type II secretion system F family protein [Phycicoccus sp. M110.8]MDU0312618.1 type II secretion system F family protein [Phycicoccus sp. M110.8]
MTAPEHLVSWPGALLGAVLALGLVLVWKGLPLNRRATLDDRLLPYLRDAPRPSRLLTTRQVGGGSALAELARPVVAGLGARLEQVLGGAGSVRRRLLRAGRNPEVERFRAEQVLWGAGGLVLGSVAGAVMWLGEGGSVVPSVVVTFCGAGAGVVARDRWLTREAERREQRMLAEFPTVAELLALAVGAGEGAVGALERVCRLSHGELSAELARCLADARAGANLPTALQGLADRTGLTSLARFVDGMIIAVERGTPLADVLRAQAQDVRETGRRAVMEAGGKKEIAMMVPVVFLVLPVTVLFAVYPGFAFLRFSI